MPDSHARAFSESSSILFLRIWLALAALALCINLGSYPLLDADEGRNGEVGREMAATNDYVMPRLDTLPYLDKPIIYFAAEAAAMEVLGPTELDARLPALLFTFATAALLCWFARRVWDERAACVAAIAYLSMPLVIAFSRTVIFDSALTFFMIAAIITFFLAIEERQKKWSVLAWASIALGVLTKGPVAILIPILVALPFAIWRKRARVMFPLLGFVVFVVVIAPWVWAVSQVMPDFLRYVLVTETAQRLATKALKRTGPPWYFIPYVLGGALPWAVVAIASWRELRDAWKQREPATMFALLWVALPFLFFSISQSKRPQYILPVMPAIALLVARATKTRAAAIVTAILGVILLAAPIVIHERRMKAVLVQSAETTAVLLGICALLGGAVALFVKRRDVAIAALALPILAIPIAAQPLLLSLGEVRSTKSLMQRVAPHVTPETEVIGIEAFTGTMCFYLQRPIVVATPDAEELTSNYLIRHFAAFADDPKSTIRRVDWGERSIDACCAPRIYIVRNNDAKHRAQLEQRGIAKLAEGAHFVVYGPTTMR